MKETLQNQKKTPAQSKKRLGHKTISMLLVVLMLFSSLSVFTTTLAEAVTNAVSDTSNNSAEDDEIIETKPLINALNDGDTVSATDAKATAFTGEVVWTDADRESATNETLSLVKMYKKADLDYYFYLPETANLKALPIFFSGYSSVKIGNTTIENGKAYDFTTGGEEVYVNRAKAYRFDLTFDGIVHANLTFMQSSSPAMYLELGEKLPIGTKATNAKGDEISNKDAFQTDGSFMVTETVGTDKYNSKKGVLDKLKGRGNASWTYSYEKYGKYSFNITLDERTKLFANLNKGKKFCLLANNADESFMHNVFSFELGKKLGLDFTPTFEYIDLYDSGDYMGSYMILDKIEIDEQSVNLSVNLDDENEAANPDGFDDSDRVATASDLTVGSSFNHYNYKGYKKWVKMTEPELTKKDGSRGAYLLELDYGDRFAKETSGFVSTNGQPVVVKYPEYASKNQVNFISEKYNKLEELLNTENATYRQINEIIDVESFIKVYLIQELSKNCDSAASSYYIYYDPAVDTKLHAGPLWDFDMGYGQLEVARAVSKTLVTGTTYQPVYGNQDLPTGWHSRIKNISGDNTNTNFVLDSYNIQAQIVNNAEVWEKVKNYFKTVNGFYDKAMGMLTGDAGTEGTIPYYVNKLNGTAAMNESRWGFIEFDKVKDFTDTGNTYEAATNFFVDWTKKRLTWLNGDEQASSVYVRKGAIERNDPREIYEIKHNYDATTYVDSKETAKAGTTVTKTIPGFEGNRYVVFDSAKASTGNFAKTTERMTWSQARDFCEQLGGHLVTFTSQGEWDFVQERLIKNKEVAFLGGYDHDSFMNTIDPVRYNVEAPDVSNRFKWVTDEPFYSSINCGSDILKNKTQEQVDNSTSGFYNIVNRWKINSTNTYGFESDVNASDDQIYMVTCSTVNNWAVYSTEHQLTPDNYGWNDAEDNNPYVTSFVCEFEEYEFSYTENVVVGGNNVTKEHRYVMYDACGEYFYDPVNLAVGNTSINALQISQNIVKDKNAYRLGSSWELAAELAARKGGHLATFTTEAEYQVMQKLMVKNDGIRAWLGGYGYGQSNGSANIQTNKSKWKWITGETYNTALDYWENLQPDKSQETENFMATFSTGNPGIGNYELNDYSRWYQFITGYICEFETSQTYTWEEKITRKDFSNGKVTDGPTRTIEHKYTLYMANMSWFEAQAYCENKGGHLATFTSEEEWEKVSKNLIYARTLNSNGKYTDDSTYNTIYKIGNNAFELNNTELTFKTSASYTPFVINKGCAFYELPRNGIKTNKIYQKDKEALTRIIAHGKYRDYASYEPFLWLGGYDQDLYTKGKDDVVNDREWKWITGEVFESYKLLQYDVTTENNNTTYKLNSTFKDEFCMVTGGIADQDAPAYWNDNLLRGNQYNGNCWYDFGGAKGFVLETEKEITSTGDRVDYNPIETTYKGNTYRILDISRGNTAFDVTNGNTTTSYLHQDNGVATGGYTTALTWTEAEELCESLGGHLATFTTMEEWNVISDLLARSYYMRTWLGGFSDNSTQTTGTPITSEITSKNKLGFRWVTGENDDTTKPDGDYPEGTEFNYPLSEFDNMWADSQPDNSAGYEHYMGTGITYFPKYGNCALNDYFIDATLATKPYIAVCEIEGAALTCEVGGSAEAYSDSDSLYTCGTPDEYISNYGICNYQNVDYNFDAEIWNGEFVLTNISGSKKESLTFTATPDDGYAFSNWDILEGSYESITDANGNEVTPVEKTVTSADGNTTTTIKVVNSIDEIIVTGASMEFAIKANFTKVYNLFCSLNPDSIRGSVSYTPTTDYSILRQTDDPNPIYHTYKPGDTVTVKIKSNLNYLTTVDDVDFSGISNIFNKETPYIGSQNITFTMPANDVNIVVTSTDISYTYDDEFYKAVYGDSTIDPNFPVNGTEEDRYQYWLENGIPNGQVASPVFDVDYYKNILDTDDTGKIDSYFATKQFATSTDAYLDGSLVFDADAYDADATDATLYKETVADYLSKYKTSNGVETSDNFSVNAFEKYNPLCENNTDFDTIVEYYKLKAKDDVADRVVNYLSKSYYTNAQDIVLGISYTDRFGNQEQKSYYLKRPIGEKDENIVVAKDISNSYLKVSEIAETNCIKMNKPLFVAIAPHISNVAKDFKLDYDSIVFKSSENGINATLDLDANATERYCSVSYYTRDANNKEQSKGTLKVKFAHLVQKKNLKNANSTDETYCITTNKADFSYWLVTDTEGKELTRCYTKDFNYIIYNDCKIKMVCNDGTFLSSGISASIDLVGYSRNPFASVDNPDTGTPVAGTQNNMIDVKNDRAYADFNVSYKYNGRLLYEVKTVNMTCGLALVFAEDGDNKDFTWDYNSVKSFLLANANGETATKIVGANKTFNSTYNNGNMKVINKNINVEDLSNKNRCDYYVGYNNSEGNRDNLLKAYSYMLIDTNKDGTYDEVVLSLSVDMCLNNIPFLAKDISVNSVI